jgi:hypothetical protein
MVGLLIDAIRNRLLLLNIETRTCSKVSLDVPHSSVVCVKKVKI